MTGREIALSPYHPDYVFVGFEPSEVTRATALAAYLESRRDYFSELPPSGQSRDPRLMWRPCTEQEFLHGARRRKEIQRQYAANGSVTLTAANCVALNWPKAEQVGVTETAQGYIQYLSLCLSFWDCVDEANAFVQNYFGGHIYFPADTRHGHTAIFGGSNSGKSELMKVLISHELDQFKSGVVVIDPHGRMAEEISRLSVFRNGKRLSYFKPQRDGWSAKLNPLNASRMNTRDKGSFAEIMSEIIGDLVDKNAQTSRMQTMLVNCLRVIFDEENGNLRDLRDMLRGPNHHIGKPWSERGRRHANPDVAYFFQNDWADRRLDVSRDGLRDRLNNIISMEGFATRFCEPANIDLEALLNAGQVVLFDFSDLAGRTRTAAGRLVLGMLAGIGLQRLGRGGSHVPVHVFLDEASSLLGRGAETLLTETRKAGIYLTLAQQVEGLGLGGEMRRVLRMNTAIKFAAGSAHDILAREMGLDVRAAGQTAQGEFWVKWGTHAQAVRVKVATALASGGSNMSHAEWVQVMQEQRRRYYRPPVAHGAPQLGAPTPSTPTPKKRKVPR